jgi:hypothetical protein
VSPLLPRPRRSIAVTRQRLVSEFHSGCQLSMHPIPPCTSSNDGPVPAVSRPMRVPSVLTTSCL